MNLVSSFKLLRNIKREHGLPETMPLAAWLGELVSTYNDSYSKFGIIAHTQANIYTQKVRHDSFSEALNRTILNLEELISNNCFPSSNREHSNLSNVQWESPTNCSKQSGSTQSQAVIYRQYSNRYSKPRFLKGKAHKREIKQSKKLWGELIQDSLLLDLYKTYITETGDTRIKSSAAHAFINAVLEHINHTTTAPSLRIQPPIPQLPPRSFRTVVKRYRVLSS